MTSGWGSKQKSKAKKQHQAGWGEGDDGEDRLGQFFRLKDGDFARTQMRFLPYGKVTHGENTWKTWTTHGKHMENTSRKHMENIWKTTEIRAMLNLFFFFSILAAASPANCYGKCSAIHEFWVKKTPHLAFFFSISQDSFVEEKKTPKHEMSGLKNFHVLGWFCMPVTIWWDLYDAFHWNHFWFCLWDHSNVQSGKPTWQMNMGQ